jgi:hypothetical protein
MAHEEQGLHTPLVPTALALPAAYAVLRYWPAEQEVTAVATIVSAMTVHALVTYWPPAVGAAQVLQVEALLALYVLPPAHATSPP